MKGFVIGVVGIGATGTVAVMGSGGGSGPNDYISQVSKPPQAVYAAFSAIAPEGVTAAPSIDGWGARVEQRITKVPNEQVKLELIIDGEAIVTAEVQFAAEGSGTRLAAEFDFNEEVLDKLVAASGETMPVAEFGFSEFMIDQVFAQAMAEMVRQVEKGEPLQSLAATHSRWGSSSRGANVSHAASYDRAHSAYRQHQAVQPQASARPQLDPSVAARPKQASPFPGPATSPAGRPQLDPNQSARPVQPAIRPGAQGGW